MQYFKLSGISSRRLFDPTKKEDIAEFKYFLEHNKWQKLCPFYLEDAWDNVPAMCKDKYARHSLATM